MIFTFNLHQGSCLTFLINLGLHIEIYRTSQDELLTTRILSQVLTRSSLWRTTPVNYFSIFLQGNQIIQANKKNGMRLNLRKV